MKIQLAKGCGGQQAGAHGAWYEPVKGNSPNGQMASTLPCSTPGK
ncbi:hypothetical protein [Polluticaenibacter yanchengensis]|uniref:Uncharacterized protein n=1 Tax=Polluticaenibacter yanchengensis TaxID=3014562 RepID=A0ABT4UJH4_9BACT|nr:hypothetical protein [Chitinophagaceae bacterium LY-5]